MSIGASYENKHTTTLCYISYNSISLQFCNLTLGGNFRQQLKCNCTLFECTRLRCKRSLLRYN